MNTQIKVGDIFIFYDIESLSSWSFVKILDVGSKYDDDEDKFYSEYDLRTILNNKMESKTEKIYENEISDASRKGPFTDEQTIEIIFERMFLKK